MTSDYITYSSGWSFPRQRKFIVYSYI